MKYWLLSLLLLTSCSKLSIGVHWADTFATSQLDNYFTLDRAAKEKARQEFKASFMEVRRQDFPRIAALLEGIAADVEKNELSSSRLLHWQSQAEADLKRAAQRFAPLANRLVEEQANRGFERFDREVEEKLADQAESLRDPESRLKQAKKRIQRVISETLGRLTDSQMEQTEKVLVENPLQLELEGRGFLLEQFRQKRADAGQRKEFMRRYFFDWDSLQKPEYIQARDSYKKKSRELMLSLLEGASEEQKKNLVDNFRSRAREFHDLTVN